MSDDDTLPLRFPYGQRYNPKTNRLDSPESKGIGFKGPLKQGDHIVSEYSSDRDIQYPSIYEGITPADIAAVMLAERIGRAPPRDVDQRAYEAAQRRVKQGRSPFFEQGKDEYPAWTPDQDWAAPAVMRNDGGAVDAALRLARRMGGPLEDELTGFSYLPSETREYERGIQKEYAPNPIQSLEDKLLSYGMREPYKASPEDELAIRRLEQNLEGTTTPQDIAPARADLTPVSRTAMTPYQTADKTPSFADLDRRRLPHTSFDIPGEGFVPSHSDFGQSPLQGGTAQRGINEPHMDVANTQQQGKFHADFIRRVMRDLADKEGVVAQDEEGIPYPPRRPSNFADGGAVDAALRVARQMGGGADDDMIERKEWSPFRGLKIRPPAEKLSSEPDIREYQQKRHAFEFEGAPEPEAPKRKVTLDAPMFGGEKEFGEVPYYYADPINKALSLAYGMKTAPLYSFGYTAPLGRAIDTYETAKRIEKNPTDVSSYLSLPKVFKGANPLGLAGVGAGVVAAESDEDKEREEKAFGGEAYAAQTGAMGMADGGVLNKALRLTRDKGRKGLSAENTVKEALRLARRPFAGGGTPLVGAQQEEEQVNNGAPQPQPAGAPNYSGFLNQLYQTQFGRAADQPGMDYWGGQLSSGAVTAQDVARNFANSGEAQQLGAQGALPSTFMSADRDVAPLLSQYNIPSYYNPQTPSGTLNPTLNPTQATPGNTTPGSATSPTTPSGGNGVQVSTDPSAPTNAYRLPEQFGKDVQSFLPALEQVQQQTLDPSDYSNFVSGLFQQGLGREADQGGRDFFTGLLASGQATPGDVANLIFASPEAQANQIGSLYQEMLGREADQNGLNYFSDMISSGKGDLYDVASTLMQSPEYQGYMNQMFEANQSGFTPVGQNDFAATALKDGVGKTGDYSVGYLDPNVWMSGGDNEVLPTSFASSILKGGLGENQQIPSGYIDPNVMLSKDTTVAGPYDFAATTLKSGLGENGAYKPYVDASINAQKVNDLIGNMDPSNPSNYVTGVYNALTGKVGDPAKVGQLSAQLTEGNLSPAEIAAYVAKENNVPLPPVRPEGLGKEDAPSGGLLGRVLNAVSGAGSAAAGAIGQAGQAVTSGIKNIIHQPISEGAQKILSFISKGEGGYNSMNQGTKNGRIVGSTNDSTKIIGKNLEDMTIGEIMKNQAGKLSEGRKLFAVGKYQIIPETMKKLVKMTGIDPNTKFDAATQDKLGMALIMSRPKLAAYVTGKSNNLNAAMLDAALEWASMPNPATGASYYGSGNKSGHSVSQVAQMLQDARKNFFKGSGEGTTVVAEDAGAPAPETEGATPAVDGGGGGGGGTPGGGYTDLSPIGGGGTSSGDVGGGGGDGDVGGGSTSTGGGNHGTHTSGGTHAPAPVTHTSHVTHTGGGGSHVTNHGSGSVSFGPVDQGGIGGTGITHGISSGVSHTSGADPYFGHNMHWSQHTNTWMDPMQARNYDPSFDLARGGVVRASGGAVKADDEDVENALKLAKGGRRVNTRLDKDPDFDMSLKSGGGAWTRKEGQNPEGGLNAKGRASAKAEGHDLKPPAPNPKTEKDAARRKSFCSRMQGMKNKLTSSETANDPDSRINKSLRVWNCHSDGGAVDNALRIAKGGEVWNKARPKDIGESKSLSKGQKKSAKAMAKAAGRPYPNLVDNMRAAQRKK